MAIAVVFMLGSSDTFTRVIQMALMSDWQLAAEVQSEMKRLRAEWEIRVQGAPCQDSSMSPRTAVLSAVARQPRLDPENGSVGFKYCVDLDIFENLQGSPKNVITGIARFLLDYMDTTLLARNGVTEASYERTRENAYTYTNPRVAFTSSPPSIPIPAICHDCHYFFGAKIGNVLTVCAVHPSGNGEFCNDYNCSKQEVVT